MAKSLFLLTEKRNSRITKGIGKLALTVISLSVSLSIANAATLSYSTFLGTNSDDYGYDIDVNDNGEAFVTGQTNSSSFPTTAGSYDQNYNGEWDVFVTKLTSDGSTLSFSTFLGNSDTDSGLAITVDASGNVILTGQTQSSNFPTQNAFDSSHNGGTYDVFVSKLTSDGSTLVFSTFLGGSDNDNGYAITVDASGNVILTGQTQSSNFPTQNAFDSSHNGGTYDVFVSKLTSDGSSLVFSTFIGGSGSDNGYAITVDANGNTILTGFTSSSNFPTQNAFDLSYNGGAWDCFVSKLTSNGTSLIFSTYLGGSSAEYGNAITIDGSGNAILTGYTTSSNFPTQNAFDSSYNGGTYDVFVSKLASDGLTLSFSTFLGGSSDDIGRGISIDASGNTFVTGYTNSNDFPTQNPTDPSHNGNADLFVTQFNPSGSALEFSTFLGGGSNDYQNNYGNPTVYENGSLFLTGFVNSGFPSTNGAFDETYNGSTYDAVVVKFQFTTGDLTPNSLVSSASATSAQIYTPQIQISNLDSSLISTATTATMEISFNGNQIYTDTQTVSEIASLSDSTVTFASLIPYKSGTYEVVVYTELGGDSDTSNDTLWTSFDAVGDLAINEFLPSGNSSLGLPNFTEFFEIANTTNQALSISNWTIENSTGQTVTVAGGTFILANSYFVLAPHDNANVNEGVPFDYDYTGTSFILNDVSDFLVVKDSSGTVVDSVFYDASWNVTIGESFERQNVKLDGNDPSNWCFATTTYGTGQNKGTPGDSSSCFTQLADGSLSANSLNFGNIALLDSAEISLILYSTGSTDLTVDSLTVTGSDFTTDLTGVSLSNGDSSIFSVKFKPTSEGAISGILEIFTNDWNTPSYSISLNGTGIDGIAPTQISDFALASHNGTSLKLRFTATGDDTTLGTATSYEIRQSTNEITETNFASATLVSNIPTPSASGILDSVTVSGLTSGTQYYFGIKAIDNAGNESPISTQTSFGRATITTISDVANDNGGQVRISFDASLNDTNISTGLNVSQYLVYRKVNPNFSPSGKNSNQILEVLPSGTWEQVGNVFATADQNYTVVIPTLADSNSTGTNAFEFLVRTQAYGMPWITSVSEAVWGHSVDNLPPTIPPNQNFVNNGNGTSTATWSGVTDPDLAFYTIWAEDLNGNFTFIKQVSPLGTPTQSETFNNVSGASFYTVGSVDQNGNESLPFAHGITSVKIEVVGNDVVLTWVGKQAATSYRIFRSATPEFANANQIGTFTANGTSPTFTDFGASQNADKYFYFVTWEN